MDGGDHRLLQSDAQLGEDRHQLRPESVKVRLGLPDIEDLDLTIGFKRAVVGAPFWLPSTSSLQLLDCGVVFLGRKAFMHEIDSECHMADDVPLLVEVQRWPQRVQAAA